MSPKVKGATSVSRFSGGNPNIAANENGTGTLRIVSRDAAMPGSSCAAPRAAPSG